MAGSRADSNVREPASVAPKLAVLGALYFSQGLPFGFFTQALPVLLRKQGVSLEGIGLASLLALPWALKFLWAPVVDRVSSARVGRRKTWIVPLQLAMVGVLVALATASSTRSLAVLMGAVLLVNLLAATQDIATDGLAVDLLAPQERGLANGLQVAGYRVGMIVGGGALLILHDRLGDRGTFLSMAILTGVATLPVLTVREPGLVRTEDRSPSLHFFFRAGTVPILLLLLVYKAGEAFATGMLRPFVVDVYGFGVSDVGWLLGMVGFPASLVGALAGGVIVNRLGRRRALVTFGLFQAVAVAGYAVLARVPPTPSGLYLVCAVEHLASSMATAALFTCMMDWCSRESAATDYTVQASTVVIATGVASSVSGFSAQALGYGGHFVLATALAVVAVAAVQRWFPGEHHG